MKAAPVENWKLQTKMHVAQSKGVLSNTLNYKSWFWMLQFVPNFFEIIFLILQKLKYICFLATAPMHNFSHLQNGFNFVVLKWNVYW